NEEGYEEYADTSIERLKKELADPAQTDDVKWLNIHGLHDTALIRSTGELLDLEPFIIGDILNVTRRARIDELDDVLFFSLKSVLKEEHSENVRVEHISFLLKDKLIVSFQELKSDFFAHIRERIRTGGGIVRRKKNDYLLYLLLDAIMENFYITIENHEGTIEE